MIDYFKQGITVFFEKKFDEAMRNFSLELSQNPLSKQARIGAILSDMAQHSEEQAIALFEYYLVTKDNGTENCEEMMEEIINAVENNLDTISNLLSDSSFEDKINAENGIRYEDFLTLIESRGSFKEAFEDIMFSTKVIISKKEDFVDFLAQLIDNGFVEISMNYLESAVSIFPNDEQLLTLIKKVQK
ncbi:MAG: tetratricopeptide repeat protein [Sulfurospirillaceae bacterium]|nr:tetratricopeptide repeat protein [Sulfurospirillaceae bacterium]MDD2827082.1 tetratricopeptide repeat protein [Sulfurospirillaceae bacterium]